MFAISGVSLVILPLCEGVLLCMAWKLKHLGSLLKKKSRRPPHTITDPYPLFFPLTNLSCSKRSLSFCNRRSVKERNVKFERIREKTTYPIVLCSITSAFSPKRTTLKKVR